MASGKTAFSVFQQPGRRGRAAGRVPAPLSLNSQRSPSPSSSVSVWSNRAAKTSVSGSLSSPRAIPAPPPRETHQLGEPQGVVEAKRLHRCRKPRPERARPAFPSPQALFHSPPPHLPFLSFQEQWRDGVDLTQVKRPGSGALSPGASAFQVSRLPCPHPHPPPSHLCSGQDEGERGEGRPQCPGWPRSPPCPHPGLSRGPGLSPAVLPGPACSVPPGSAPGASMGLSRGQRSSQESPGRKWWRCWAVGPQGPGPRGDIHSP